MNKHTMCVYAKLAWLRVQAKNTILRKNNQRCTRIKKTRSLHWAEWLRFVTVNVSIDKINEVDFRANYTFKFVEELKRIIFFKCHYLFIVIQ